jgi:hypothetical protein
VALAVDDFEFSLTGFAGCDSTIASAPPNSEPCAVVWGGKNLCKILIKKEKRFFEIFFKICDWKIGDGKLRTIQSRVDGISVFLSMS